MALSSPFNPAFMGITSQTGGGPNGVSPTRVHNAAAANIAFNLLKNAAGEGVTIGPILLGAAKPVHVLTPSATVRRIINMTALTVVEAGQAG